MVGGLEVVWLLSLPRLVVGDLKISKNLPFRNSRGHVIAYQAFAKARAVRPPAQEVVWVTC